MVFVLDRKGRPLMPTHPARARQLLRAGRAVVHRLYPFTIRLKDRVGGEVQPVRLKLDPGSKVTGIAVVREGAGQAVVLHLADLGHKTDIQRRLDQRRAYRRGRRSRKLRYRAPRFSNRRRGEGWLPPSLRARVENILFWVRRYRRLLPVAAISLELARFDTQAMQNPEIRGREYQHGELAVYEVKEYLLAKFNPTCAYCGGKSGDPVLEIDHIVPPKRGGSHRVSNLALACRTCNQEKGGRTAAEFGFPEVQERAKAPLRDAAAINSTRWALWRALAATGLPLEVGTGGRTKYNRTRLGLPKSHALDALCVGTSTPEQVQLNGARPLTIQAQGRGQYRRTNVSACGFPRGYLARRKVVAGFRTGDLVRAIVPQGKYAGRHAGVVLVRQSGYFDLKRHGRRVVQGIHARHFRLLQRSDGYGYEHSPIPLESPSPGGRGQAALPPYA